MAKSNSSSPFGSAVYAELRRAARNAMAAEARRGGEHTLSPTALVNEAYVRLARSERGLPELSDCGGTQAGSGQSNRFLAAAATAMRRVLVDHARARIARRRRERGHALAAPEAAAPPTPRAVAGIRNLAALAAAGPEEILAVDAALLRLEGEDPEAATLVGLRFYTGLAVDRCAEVMGISPRSAARLWKYARARLQQMLTETAD